MNKASKIFISVTSCVLVVVLAAAAFFTYRMSDHIRSLEDRLQAQDQAHTEQSTALSEQNKVLLERLNSLTETVENYYNGSPDPAQEDDIKISSEYMIKSTANISDAYKSGDTSSLTDKEKDTLAMAKKVLDEIITADMTPYEKELAVYKWMTTSLKNDSGLLPVIPTTQADCDNPYGVLKYHNAVCVGYATTFRLFMQMLDIPCMVVHNSERFHTWNLVQLDDGWYHTDIYSDSAISNFSHFNRTDEMQQSDQSWNRDFFPAADTTKYCYAVMNAVRTDDVYRIPKALRAALDGTDNNVSFSIPADPDNINMTLVESMLNDISGGISSSVQYSGTEITWNWSLDGDRCYVSVSIMRGGGEFPGSAISEKDMQKAHDAVDKAFSDIWSENDVQSAPKITEYDEYIGGAKG